MTNPAAAKIISSQSIPFNCCAIIIPTTINAGAVTAFVTVLKISGDKNTASKKQTPDVQAVKPVRPPTPTPELDSTKLVTVLVPKTAPNTVPNASATKACSAFSSSPLSLIKPIRLPIATSVPAVSKKSTNKNEKITTKAWNGFANNSEIPEKQDPKACNSKSNEMKCSGKVGILAIPMNPRMIPIIAVITIPTKTAAGTFLITNAIVINKPTIANNTVGSVKFPIVTNVAGLATMIPAFFKPTNAIKKPIPAPIANFNCTGIALIIALRTPVTEIRIKITPEINTALKAAAQLKPICPQIV